MNETLRHDNVGKETLRKNVGSVIKSRVNEQIINYSCLRRCRKTDKNVRNVSICKVKPRKNL